MSTYSNLIDDIASVVRDTTSATQSLIETYLKEVIEELQEDVRFPELLGELSITGGSSSSLEFSATTGLKTSNIIDIRDPNGSQRALTLLDNRLFDRIQVDQSSTSGYPEYYRIKDETSIHLYPYGSATTYEMKYYKSAADFTANSQTFPLSRVAYKAVRDGVVAEVLTYKDDDRDRIYQAKYNKGVGQLRKFHLNVDEDYRMQPGYGDLTNSDFERIFGDDC